MAANGITEDDLITIYQAEDDDSSGDCPNPPCNKKSQKKAVKDMSAGEFYGMAYNAPAMNAFERGGDPYIPTEADIAKSEKESAEAALELAMLVVPVGRALKILRLGKYSRVAYHECLNLLKNLW